MKALFGYLVLGLRVFTRPAPVWLVLLMVLLFASTASAAVFQVTAEIFAISGSTASVPLVVTGNNGQTADLADYDNYLGSVLASVAAGGTITAPDFNISNYNGASGPLLLCANPTLGAIEDCITSGFPNGSALLTPTATGCNGTVGAICANSTLGALYHNCYAVAWYQSPNYHIEPFVENDTGVSGVTHVVWVNVTGSAIPNGTGISGYLTCLGHS